MDPSRNQDRTPDGKLVKGAVINPDGKGGFGDNPQNRSNGRWSKEGSISYQYQKLIRMTNEELANFKPVTVAEEIALVRVKEAKKEKGLYDLKEITDRTEGKAPQFIGFGDEEEYKKILVEFVGDDDQHDEDPNS